MDTQTLSSTTFRYITPYLGIGDPAPHGWRPLAEMPMLVVVGLTSVGKSSAISALAAHGVAYSSLPDRRDLVSALIITQMQIEAGEPVRELNRFERYPILRRFNQHYYGGLAYGLARCWVDPTQLKPQLILNGLRGEAEIVVGVEAFPRATFLSLDAPDIVRLTRMFARHDPHDIIDRVAPLWVGRSAQTALTPGEKSFAALGVPDAAEIFDPTQESELFGLVQRGTVSLTELRDKLRIFVEERRTYDPVATRAALARLAPQRTVFVDTTTQSPDEIARIIVTVLGA